VKFEERGKSVYPSTKKVKKVIKNRFFQIPSTEQSIKDEVFHHLLPSSFYN
jgi:hypothetical protein